MPAVTPKINFPIPAVLGAFSIEDGFTYAQLKKTPHQASASDIYALVGELSGKLELSLLVRQRVHVEQVIVKHWHWPGCRARH